MALFLKKALSWNNVAAGNDVSLQLPLGLTYDEVHIFYGTSAGADQAAKRALFKNLKLRVDGKIIQEFKDLAELQKLNSYAGYTDVDGKVVLYLRDNAMFELRNRRGFALGTNGLAKVELEMSIDSGATAASLPAALYVQSNQNPLRTSDGKAIPNMVRKLRPYNFPVTGAGPIEIDNIVKVGAISRIYLESADLDDIEVVVDNAKVYEATKAQIAALANQYDRVADSSMVCIDFMLEGDPTTVLPLAITDMSGNLTYKAQDFRVKANYSGGAGAIRVMVEYLDAVNGAA